MLEFNKFFGPEYADKAPNTGFLAIVYALELLKPKNLWVIGLDFYQSDYLFRRAHQSPLNKQQEKMERIDLINIFTKIIKDYPETKINFLSYYKEFPRLKNLHMLDYHKKNTLFSAIPFSVKRRIRQLAQLIYPLFRKISRTLKSRNGLLKKQVGDHVMLLRSDDAGISSSLLEMKPDSPDREAAFMHIIRQEIKQLRGI